MRAAVELPVQSAVAAQVEQEQSHGELIFGYFWLFLAIFGDFWLFLVILVIVCRWAIRLTAFYLLTGQRRVVARHRRVRAA